MASLSGAPVSMALRMAVAKIAVLPWPDCACRASFCIVSDLDRSSCVYKSSGTDLEQHVLPVEERLDAERLALGGLLEAL
jgi:hypothetical protein